MSDTRSFTPRARLRSFVYAFRGIRAMFQSQHNVRIHAAATALVVASGVAIGVTPLEWCALTGAMTLVWMAEALNTAIEFLCDAAIPEFHPLVERSKDVAAGAVLLSAIGAALIALFVFCPYLLARIFTSAA